MAEAVKKAYYAGGAVHGSLAYDLNHPELFREMPDVVSLPRTETHTRTRTVVRTHAAAASKTKQSLAPTALAGMLVAAFLLVICMSAKIQLLDISSESAALETQLENLLTEQSKLKIAYESAFNYSEVEEYAVTNLGMQKPQADQICYIDTASPDRTEILCSSASDSFVDRVSDFLTGFTNLLR